MSDVVRVPSVVVRSPKVTGTALRLYALLLAYAQDNGTQVVTAPQQELATYLNITSRQVRTLVQALQSLGLVSVVPSELGINHYGIQRITKQVVRNLAA